MRPLTLPRGAARVNVAHIMKLNLKPLFAVLMPLSVLYSCSVTKPPAPANTGVDIPKIEQPISNIEVPVSVDLKNYFVQAENSVPYKFADKLFLYFYPHTVYH